MHGVILPERHFPEPWSVEELDACFVVKDLNGQALAYMYFEKSRVTDIAAVSCFCGTRRGVSRPFLPSCRSRWARQSLDSHPGCGRAMIAPRRAAGNDAPGLPRPPQVEGATERARRLYHRTLPELQLRPPWCSQPVGMSKSTSRCATIVYAVVAIR